MDCRTRAVNVIQLGLVPQRQASTNAGGHEIRGTIEHSVAETPAVWCLQSFFDQAKKFFRLLSKRLHAIFSELREKRQYL